MIIIVISGGLVLACIIGASIAWHFGGEDSVAILVVGAFLALIIFLCVGGWYLTSVEQVIVFNDEYDTSFTPEQWFWSSGLIWNKYAGEHLDMEFRKEPNE